MSYCRFENTFNDLRDCSDNMEKEGLSQVETVKRQQLIELCIEIAENYGDEHDEDDEDDGQPRDKKRRGRRGKRHD